MAYDDDEEQIEAIKRWWKENGTSLIVSIALVAVLVFGWRQWQSSRQATAEQAANLYQQLVELASVNPALGISAASVETATRLNQSLRSEHENTVYAGFAALFMAKLHVDAGELQEAESQLRWILDNAERGFLQDEDTELLLTARLHLARVALARDEATRALSLLEEVEPGAFAGLYAEVQGDAYVALGQQDEARAAYQRAMQSGSNAVLELKLSDLGSI